MMLIVSIGLVISLSALGGFVAGRSYGLELALRRILRAYETA
jgi:hypothetical protein